MHKNNIKFVNLTYGIDYWSYAKADKIKNNSGDVAPLFYLNIRRVLHLGYVFFIHVCKPNLSPLGFKSPINNYID